MYIHYPLIRIERQFLLLPLAPAKRIAEYTIQLFLSTVY